MVEGGERIGSSGSGQGMTKEELEELMEADPEIARLVEELRALAKKPGVWEAVIAKVEDKALIVTPEFQAGLADMEAGRVSALEDPLQAESEEGTPPDYSLLAKQGLKRDAEVIVADFRRPDPETDKTSE